MLGDDFMFSRHLIPIILGSLSTFATNADEILAGKKLADDHCYQCHGTELYTRGDRRITSLQKLHAQVRRCELSLGLKWFEEDIDNVTAYLNKEFYKFE